ncbi:G1 S-specific cyclin-D2 [Brachionus plicatilis]|uniref:G1 S-specific cyclin-D2 n=1 Tax=Brachionus plicatilis TaxID=10195 RepID=A0A3M7R409_BRAPC|nr:G1 S-specific cyclin-D2 [Brachionus plicatilis]
MNQTESRRSVLNYTSTGKEYYSYEEDSGNSSNCSIESLISTASLRAPNDHHLLSDHRNLTSLLFLEDLYRIQSDYFSHIQTEIKPWMRKMLANWMLEVCRNQNQEADVFITAMNILDRFLSLQAVSKRHLQLLGTTCMFIAAKLRSSSQLNAHTLVIYTANSISIEQLLDWEQMVLAKLKWDINSITACDYVPILLSRLNIIEHKNIKSIRSYIDTLVAMCSTDFKFSMVSTSVIATGCLYLAIKYLNNLDEDQCEQILAELTSASNCVIDTEILVQCIEQIEEVVQSEVKN